LPPTHLVVDGSNIATEGRSLPSLSQLLDAVDAVTKEHPGATVTVIVDATFGHRIDASERAAYEERIDRGEIITPPAGVIGRGDAFILEVADRAGAVILSNDSFQEFHGTFDWLFQEGRLLGGKHVPGVGWIFLPRSPVRGPTSRKAVSDAKRKRRGSTKAAAKPESKRPSASRPAKAATRSRSKAASKVADEPAGRKRGGKEPKPYNEPLPFIEFVGAHPVGSIIEAEVEEFASHGAYVVCDGTRCYISLKSISDPPPRSAREVLTLGETREFVVQAIDTPRRGIDLAMPGVVLAEPDESGGPDQPDERPAAEPTDEPTEVPAAERPAEPPAVVDGEQKLSVSQRRKLRVQQAEAVARAAAEEGVEAPAEEAAPRSRARRATKAAAEKAPTTRKAASQMATKKAASKKATAKKATAKKSRPASRVKKAAAKKATARKAPAKKATTKKSAVKKSTAKKSTAKKAAAKKSTAKKATAKKSTAKKAAAKKSTPASRAKKAGAKRTPAKRAATKRA